MESRRNGPQLSSRHDDDDGLINSRVNSQVKFAALSLETRLGMSVNCQKDSIASQQFLAVKLLSGTACGKPEVLSRKTRA